MQIIEINSFFALVYSYTPDIALKQEGYVQV